MAKTTTFNLTTSRKALLHTIYRISKGMQHTGDFVPYSTYRKFEEAGYVYRQENLEWALTIKGLDALHLVRPTITPADAVTLLGADTGETVASEAEWIPQEGDKVYMRLTDEYGVIGRVLIVMGITLYNVALNEDTEREFYRDEIEFVSRPAEPTPAPAEPREPLAELARLREALTEIRHLIRTADTRNFTLYSISRIEEIADTALGGK